MFSYQWPNTVDYPSRSFGNAFTNSIAAMNGIFFLLIVSFFLDKHLHAKLTSVVVKIGHATLGILLFHFIFFKAGYAILAAYGVVDWGYIVNFIPTPEIGDRYWLLISSFSIMLSIITWNLILKVNFLRLILGQSRDVVNKLYQVNTSMAGRFDQVLIAWRARFGKMVQEGILETIHQNKVVSGGLGVLIYLAVLPMLEQGVILNDELQTSFWAQL